MPWSPPSHTARKRSRRASDAAYRRAKRKGGGDIRSTARWQKTRRMKLRRNPLCEPCQRKGLITEAQQVHHLTPIKEAPDLALSMENLESICTRCHARENARERRG